MLFCWVIPQWIFFYFEPSNTSLDPGTNVTLSPGKCFDYHGTNGSNKKNLLLIFFLILVKYSEFCFKHTVNKNLRISCVDILIRFTFPTIFESEFLFIFETFYRAIFEAFIYIYLFGIRILVT